MVSLVVSYEVSYLVIEYNKFTLSFAPINHAVCFEISNTDRNTLKHIV